MSLKTHKQHGLTKEILTQLYEKDYLSDKEIGNIYSLSDAGVSYLRKKHNIKTLTAEQRITGKAKLKGLSDITTVSKEKMLKLYKSKGQRLLAKEFGCSRILIKKKLKEFGIDSINKTERLRESLPTEFTETQNKIVYGSLLGDGHLALSKNKQTAYFQEHHSIKQKQYLEWKRDVLYPFSTKIIKVDKKLDDNRMCYGFGFKTHCSKLFLEYRNLFYPDGVKKLPDDFKEKIDGIVLAIWYMDGGHLAISDSNINGQYQIASNFEVSDLENLICFLNAQYDLDVSIISNDCLNILTFNNKDRFFEMIKNHIQPSLYYKISLKQRFYLPKISKPNLEKFLKDFPTVLNDENILDDLVDYWQIRGFPYLHYSEFPSGWIEKQIKLILKSNFKLQDVRISAGYTKGDSFCLSNFNNLFDAKRFGEKSAVEMFNDRKKLKHIVKDCYQYIGKPTKVNLRQSIMQHSKIYTFRPEIAKGIYDKYCLPNSSVLDPCGGWGGRMLGACCSKKVFKYVCVDACQNTVKGLKHCSCFINRYISNKHIEVYYDAFEDWQTDDKFDLIFTSPPYYKKEIYSNDETQSCNRYDTYTEWKDKFLYVLIDKSINLLHNGGYLIINMANIKIKNEEFNIADDVENYLNCKLKHVETYCLVNKNFYNGKENNESVFVFSKFSSL